MTGCVRDFSEPAFSVDADGKLTFTVGVSIPEAQVLATRGTVLDGTPLRPTGEYLSNLNFYMFVFEDNGSSLQSNYLRELVYGKDIIPVNDDAPVPPMTGEADPDHNYGSGAGTESKGLVNFKVRLDGTAENAILHLVVTSDPYLEEQLKEVSDRSELGIFSGAAGLFTANNEAYWKRIELNCPINADNAPAIQAQLQHVNLVRNFARVTLKVDLDDVSLQEVGGFTPLGFVIVNAVGSGYVAAYNESLGEDGLPGFVEFEEKDARGVLTGKMRSYGDLTKTDRYVPARHPASDLVNPDDDLSWSAAFEDMNGETTAANNAPKFTFERSVQNDHHTFVIVKGLFRGESDPVYFKLDIGTKDNTVPENQSPFGVFENYHLIRNMSYDITIKRILSKEVGHKSVEGAVGAPPSNNVSTSIETRPLNSIQDGVDRMRVSKATVVIVDTEVLDEYGVPKTDPQGNVMLEPSVKNFDMKWMYTENYQSKDQAGAPTRDIPNEVKWNYPGYEFLFVGGKDPDGIIAAWDGNNGKTSQTVSPIWNSDASQSDAKTFDDGWMGFTLNFNLPDDIVRQKTIRFYRYDGLTRDVVFISHKRWEFVNNVEVFPGAYSYDNGTLNKNWRTLDDIRDNVPSGNVGSYRGAEFTVMFELPADLPQSLFPLEFKIGTDRQNNENAFTGNALVVWGKSMFEGDPDEIGVPRMQYVKTVTWDYYNGNGIAGHVNETGHRVVTVRFLTTTDLLETPEVGNSSLTRVRVDNDYFVRGEGSFDRDATTDETLRWRWTFYYPLWNNYFAAGNLQPGSDGYYEFDGLKHKFDNANYSYNSGGYMVMATSSQDSPDYIVDLSSNEIQSETGYSGVISIDGSTNKDGFSAYEFPRYMWTRYNRTVKIKITTNQRNFDLSDMAFTDDGEDRIGMQRTAKIDRSTEYSYFDLNANEILKKVEIWSVMKLDGDHPTEEKTRYYEIKMTLTKK